MISSTHKHFLKCLWWVCVSSLDVLYQRVRFPSSYWKAFYARTGGLSSSGPRHGSRTVSCVMFQKLFHHIQVTINWKQKRSYNLLLQFGRSILCYWNHVQNADRRRTICSTYWSPAGPMAGCRMRKGSWMTKKRDFSSNKHFVLSHDLRCRFLKIISSNIWPIIWMKYRAGRPNEGSAENVKVIF